MGLCHWFTRRISTPPIAVQFGSDVIRFMQIKGSSEYAIQGAFQKLYRLLKVGDVLHVFRLLMSLYNTFELPLRKTRFKFFSNLSSMMSVGETLKYELFV